MTRDDRSLYRAHLSRIPMFGSCTPEQLDRLAELGHARTASDSDDVVREGDKGGTFFVITGGHACVTRGGREVDMLEPGDYFGEITAVGPLSLVSLPRAAFTQALNEIPAFRDSLLHGMARRLHDLDRRV